MNHNFRPTIILFIVLLSGCSTGAYLKPEAPGGTYSTENPACPGAKKVIEFHPTGDNWIVFRVLSKLPNKYNPEGTKLIAYFRFIYGMPPKPMGMLSVMFPNEEQTEELEQLIEKRQNLPLLITASSPDATIVLSDGSTKTVSLPFFEKSYDPDNVGRSHNIRGPEVLISTERLEDFTVIFPTIYFNGKELDIPPVKFGIGRGKYTPVLNC